MPVDHHVDALAARNQRVAAPLAGLTGLPQMRQQHHEFRARCASFVDGALHCLCQFAARFVFAEPVYAGVVVVAAPERARRRRRKRGGRGDAHERHAHRPACWERILFYGARVEHKRGRAGAVVGEVAAEVFRVRASNQVVELRHAVVELVVAGDDDIVAAFVHDIDERLTLRNRAHHLSLHGVARVYQRDVFGAENAAAVGNIAR